MIVNIYNDRSASCRGAKRNIHLAIAVIDLELVDIAGINSGAVRAGLVNDARQPGYNLGLRGIRCLGCVGKGSAADSEGVVFGRSNGDTA